ncbi:hypothetical protein EYF80_017120 [Liparis tanakae]|uniref:Uncharacterized protein n=1 Tax=Liparis tanakae TaxID=230148 RepID=A0A4Z2I4H5_9TELE|nr:hypothetical protein EYF80_017120 [Liparis tanakae]
MMNGAPSRTVARRTAPMLSHSALKHYTSEDPLTWEGPALACGKARGLQQTLWRCKSRAMLAWLCRWRGFTPECEKAWGGQSLVSQKTPYSGCPSLNCVCLQTACHNKDFFW